MRLERTGREALEGRRGAERIDEAIVAEALAALGLESRADGR